MKLFTYSDLNGGKCDIGGVKQTAALRRELALDLPLLINQQSSSLCLASGSVF